MRKPPTTKSRGRRDHQDAPKVSFSATLLSPLAPAASRASRGQASKATAKAVPGDWVFLNLPREASAKLPSRGMVSVEGTLNGSPFQATLEPDGQGGHWLKVDRRMRQAAHVEKGDIVTLEISVLPPDKEPEPSTPADLRKALAAAPPKTREAWWDITPAARRDFIHWITSPKQAATRARRITTACDMLAKGKRRPCCFDRSGMYSNSLSCPVAETDHVKRDTK